MNYKKLSIKEDFIRLDSAMKLAGLASTGGHAKNVIQNGEVIRIVDLQNVPTPYEFEVISPDGGYNTVRVEYGKIGIVHASCPDQICVKQGFIANGVLPVVCLPNRLSVVITDDSNDLDAVTGGITQ